MSKYTEIGKVLKPHGVHGELKCVIEDAYMETLLKQGVIYIKVGAAELPYFLENIRSQDPYLVKFEDIESKEAAKVIAHRAIKMESKLIETVQHVEVEDNLEYGYLLGWKLIDETIGEVGFISEVQEFPQQEMAIILKDEQEIFVPLHEQLISKIDHAQQEIKMNLPDGLIAI